MIFQISLGRFIEEVRRWQVNDEFNSVEREDAGESVIFYFSVPRLNKYYLTVVSKDNMGDAKYINAKQAVRINPDLNLLRAKLNELQEDMKENANPKI